MSQVADGAQVEKPTNWAGNDQYSTTNLHPARSTDQVRQLARQLPGAKALGTRHCFNDIADSDQNLISIREMNRVVALDAHARTVAFADSARSRLSRDGLQRERVLGQPRAKQSGSRPPC